MRDQRHGPEFEALVQGYVDGSLAPAECRRLLHMLREQPDLHDVIVAELRMDMLVQAAVRQDSAAAEEIGADTSPHGVTTPAFVDHQEYAETVPAADGAAPATVTPIPIFEHGVQPSPLQRWRRVWPLAAGIAFAVGASCWFAVHLADRAAAMQDALAQPGTARITALSGTVAVVRSDDRLKAREGMLLLPGDAVVTGSGSLAKLEYSGEPSWIEVASETEITFDVVGEAKRLALRRGRFEAEVAPQPAGRPMICLTPQGRATVLGTRFFLTALQEHGRLEVLRGTVQLETGDALTPANVREGEIAVVAAGPQRTLERIGGRGIFEAESLDIVSSYGGSIISESDADASGNYHRVLHANRAGGSISYAVPVEVTGRYAVHVRFNQRSNRGIYQLFINGQPRAEPFDFSRRGGAHRFVELEFCTFEVAATGPQVFTFENRGRAAYGSSHKLSVDYFKLVRVPDATGAAGAPATVADAGAAAGIPLIYDFNALPVAASTRDGMTVMLLPAASGGNWLRYNADAPGDKVTFKVNIPMAGRYRVAVKLLRNPQGGIVQLAADDGNLSFNNIGGRMNLYNETETVEEFEPGSVTFAGAGTKQIRFEVKGRNPGSSGFGIGFDLLTLQRSP